MKSKNKANRKIRKNFRYRKLQFPIRKKYKTKD